MPIASGVRGPVPHDAETHYKLVNAIFDLMDALLYREAPSAISGRRASA